MRACVCTQVCVRMRVAAGYMCACVCPARGGCVLSSFPHWLPRLGRSSGVLGKAQETQTHVHHTKNFTKSKFPKKERYLYLNDFILTQKGDFLFF